MSFWSAVGKFFLDVGKAVVTYAKNNPVSFGLQSATLIVGVKGFMQAKQMMAKGQDILANKTSAGGKLPVIYGTRRVGAQIVYMDVSANDSRDLYVVYALSVGECDEIIGRTIELDGNPLTDSARFRDGGYIGSDRISSGSGSLNTASQNGTGVNAGAGQFGSNPSSRYRYVMNLHHGAATQTADPMLVASMPNWTTAHKLNGVAYIAAHYGYDKEGIWSGVPQLTVQVRGKKVFDPRDTNQTFGTVSTYKYSDNPALTFLDYITNNEYGKGLTQSQINMSTFSSAANVCDTQVDQPYFNGSAQPLTWSGSIGDDFITIGGTNASAPWWQNKIGEQIYIYDANGDGVIDKADIKEIQRNQFYDENEELIVYIDDILTSTYSSQTGSSLVKVKRFHCNGYLDANKNVMDNAKELLANMRGIFLYIDGKYELSIEDLGTATFNITDDHIIADAGISVNYGKKDKKANKVIVEFYNANKKYELDTATVLHDASPEYYSDDGDEILEIKAEFPYISDPYIAYNMGKAILARSRKQMTIQFLGTPEMYKLNVGDIVTLSYVGTFDTVQTCRVEALELEPNGLVAVSLIEYFDVYTWETPPEEPLEELANLPSAYAVKAPTGLTFTDTDSSSTGRPFLSWNEPTDFPDYQYRVNVVDGSGNQVINRIVDVENCDLNFVPTGSYVASVTSLNTLGTESNPARFPTTGTFTIGDAPAGTPDIKDEAITVDKLGDGSVTNIKVANLSAAKINTGELNLGQESGMAVRQTKTGYTSTATGFWLGNDGGTPKFNIGTSTNYLKFDGTDLDISGEISATTGSIGGFTVGTNSLIAGTNTSRISLSTVNGIHLGNNTFASAPFRVALNGDLTATNATIDGNITATTLDVVEANIQNLTLTLGGGILQDGSGGNLTVTNVINPDFPVDGLLHYFPLNGFSDPNDTTPADIIDVVSDVTGVITGSNGSFETDSPNGQSYVNGATTGITLLNNAQATTWQSTTGDYTVALWFKSTTEAGVAFARIIGRDASDFWSLTLDQNETGNQTITLYTDQEGTTWDGVSVNEWHHIALVVNGTTSAKVYVDGILRITDTDINYTTQSRPVVLGCNTENVINTSSNVFLGKFSDVRFYTKNITDKQVQSLYMNPAGGLPAKIEGDLFVSNSITADKLIVNSLDSISANLGSITAGSIDIGSGDFTVTSAGVMSATGASINGTFVAGSGTNIFTADADGIYLGNATFANAPFKALNTGEVQTTKSFTAGVAGSGEIAKMAGTGDYRFWSGNETPSNASFSVDKLGKVIAKNLVLKLTDGTVYFDSQSGFSDSALSQISLTTGTKVSTISNTFDADIEYEQITVTEDTDVNVSVSIDTNFGGSDDDFSYNPAVDGSENDIPDEFTLTIQHSSDGGSNYTNVLTDTFTRVNDRQNPKTTPASDEYKINTATDILYLGGQGGIRILASTTTSLNQGCVDADGRTTLTYTGLTLTGISTGTTHRIKATVSTTDTSYDTTNNNVSSTAPRVISVTDPSGDGFYVGDSSGSQVAPAGDITRVQITTASNSGLTGGANFASGDALFTLALDSTISGSKTFSNNVVIQGNLDVQGTTTTIDTTNLDVKDKNITLNYGTGDTSANANGAGITIQDAVSAGNDATLTWNTSNDRFNFSHPVNITSTADATPAFIATNTGGQDSVIQRWVGDSDSIELQCGKHGGTTGDYSLVNTQQNNGLMFFDGSGGVDILYNGAVVQSWDSIGGTNLVSGSFKVGGSEIINSSGVYLNTISSSQVTTALGYTPYQESTALSATTGVFSSTVNIDGELRLDARIDGGNGDNVLAFADSGGNYSIRHNVNDGNGNYSISIGYKGDGNGQYAVTGDGVGKILFGGHGRDGAVSINSAPTGTASNDISFSIGLLVDGSDNTIRVGASANGTGMDTAAGTKVFDASANAFATSYSIGTQEVITSARNLTINEDLNFSTNGFADISNTGTGAIRFKPSSQTLALTLTGANATFAGTVTADGLTVVGDAIIQDATPTLEFKDTDNNLIASIAGASGSLLLKADTGGGTAGESMQFHTGGVIRQNISAGGDISFYEDTGSTAKFFWDASAESLGIGDIPSSIDGVLAIRSDSDSHAITIYEPVGANENWQLGVDADGDLGFYNSGSTTASVTFHDSGSVGIGTTSPSQLLELSGADAPAIRLNDTTYNQYAEITSNNAGSLLLKADVGNGGTGSTYIGFEVDGANEAMRIDSSGRLGIGTTSPSNSLHIASADATVAHFQHTDGINSNIRISDTSDSFYLVSRDGIGSIGGVNSSSGSNLNIDLTSGNVGIGTDSPTAPLHVSGSASTVAIKIDNTGTGGDAWRIWSTNDAASDGGGKLGFYNEDTTTRAMTLDSSGNATFAGTISSGAITASGTSHSFLSGDSSGQLRVGRNATEHLRLFVSDFEALIEHRQDETANNHFMTFNINSPTSGSKYFNFTNGSIYVGGTEIITTGRNLTNVNSLAIGTASTTLDLDVKKSLSGSVISRVWNSNTAGTGSAVLRLANSGNNVDGSQLQFTDNTYYVGTITADRTNGMRFRVANASDPIDSSTIRLTINPSGNATFAGTINSGAITTVGDITVGVDGTPTLFLSDTGNAGGGGASGKLLFKNTGGDAIGIGYTGDVTTNSDLIISTNAGGTYGGYLGLNADGILDTQADIILEPKTNVRIATGSIEMGTTPFIDQSLNLTNIGTADFSNTIYVNASGTYAIHDNGSVGWSYSPQESGAAGSRFFLLFNYDNNASYPYLTNRTPGGRVSIYAGTAAGGGENEKIRVNGGDGTTEIDMFGTLDMNTNNITGAGTISSGNITAPKLYINNGTTYGVGIVNGASARFDTVDSGDANDPLELCYYNGNGVRIGPNGGDQYLSAGSIQITGTTVISSSRAVTAVSYNGPANSSTVIKGYNGTPLVTGVDGAAYYYGSDSGSYGIVIQGGHPICKSVKIGSVNAGTTVIDSSRNLTIVTATTSGKLNVGSASINGRDMIEIQTSDNTLDRGISFQNSGAAYSNSIFAENVGGNDARLVFTGGDASSTITALSRDFMINNQSGGGGVQGDIHARGDVVAFSTTVTSDERLKYDIEDIKNPLEIIQSLKGRHFKWKKNDTQCSGVIAQEVEQTEMSFLVAEKCDIENTDQTIKRVKYDGFIGVLIEAIKDQQKQIDELKQRLDNGSS